MAAMDQLLDAMGPREMARVKKLIMKKEQKKNECVPTKKARGSAHALSDHEWKLYHDQIWPEYRWPLWSYPMPMLFPTAVYIRNNKKSSNNFVRYANLQTRIIR